MPDPKEKFNAENALRDILEGDPAFAADELALAAAGHDVDMANVQVQRANAKRSLAVAEYSDVAIELLWKHRKAILAARRAFEAKG